MADLPGIRLAQRSERPEVLAAEVAARHFGAIARRQLLAAGFTAPRIHRWVGTGRLHPRYLGVFAWGRPDLPAEGELAAGLLYAGHGAALTGLAALWWLNLLGKRPDTIDILTPTFVSSRNDLLIGHRDSVARTWHRGLPVSPLTAALPLAAGSLGHNSLRLVLARAEYEGLLSLTALNASLSRGRAGTSAVRAAMNAHLPQLARCENRLEREFVLLCERFGLPIPEPNERKGRFRPDMLWERAKLIVELDGWRAHHTAAQRKADNGRQSYLESRGYLVLRFSRDDVFLRPDFVAAAVAAAIG